MDHFARLHGTMLSDKNGYLGSLRSKRFRLVLG